MTPPFEFPDFFEYPPYFTVQPTPETQRKQVELWKSLILRYCAHHRMFILDLEDDAHPLFANPRIQRRLNADARRLFVGELINGGGGEWLEKGKSRCLVLWRSVAAWAELLYAWAAECGYQGQVVTMDEVVGEEGPRDLRGASEELVMRAVRCLEGGGKAAYIGGEGGDDAGIKFF